MVAFLPPSPFPKVEPVPNWGTSVRGMSDTPDESSATALKGIAGLVGSGLKALDTLNEEEIKSKAREEIDAIFQRHGADLPPDAVAILAGVKTGRKFQESSIGGEIPENITEYESRLSRLAQLRSEGKLTSAYFNAEVEAITKSLKRQYPGYTDYIDGVVEKYVNTPANKVVQEIRAAFERREAKLTELDKETKQMLPTLLAVYGETVPVVNPQTGEVQQLPLTFERVRDNIDFFRNAYAKAVSLEAKEKLIKTQNFLTQNEAVELSKSIAFNTSEAITARLQLQLAANGIKEPLADIVRRWQERGPSSAKEVEQVIGVISSYITLTEQKYLEELNRPINYNGRKVPLSSLLTKEQIEDGKQRALFFLTTLRDAVLDKNKTSMAELTEQIQTIASGTIGRRLSQDETFLLLTQLKKQGFLEIPGIRDALGSPEFRENIVKGLLGVMNPSGTVNKPGQALQNIVGGKPDGSTPQVPVKTFNSTMEIYRSLALSRDPEHIKQAIYSVYRDTEFWQRIPSRELPGLFNKFASPEVIKNITTVLRDDPKSVSVYRQWMERVFYISSKDAVQGAAQGLPRLNPPPASVFWNPEIKKFDVTPLPGAPAPLDNPAGTELALLLHGRSTRSKEDIDYWLNYEKVVDLMSRVNTSLGPLVQFYEAMGLDPNKEIPRMLSGAGLPVEVGEYGKEWIPAQPQSPLGGFFDYLKSLFTRSPETDTRQLEVDRLRQFIRPEFLDTTPEVPEQLVPGTPAQPPASGPQRPAPQKRGEVMETIPKITPASLTPEITQKELDNPPEPRKHPRDIWEQQDKERKEFFKYLPNRIKALEILKEELEKLNEPRLQPQIRDLELLIEELKKQLNPPGPDPKKVPIGETEKPVTTTANAQSLDKPEGAKAFLEDRKTGKKVNIENLDDTFAVRLAAAIRDAESATGAKAVIRSGTRTREEQAALYAYHKKTGKGLAAPPGYSYHEKGQAVDIVPGPVLTWLHKNAHKYGLRFLTGPFFKVDPVHIQLDIGKENENNT